MPGEDDFRIVLDAHGEQNLARLRENLRSLVDQSLIDVVSIEPLEQIFLTGGLMERSFNREELQKLVDKAPNELKSEVKKAVEFLIEVDDAISRNAATTEQVSRQVEDTNATLERITKKLDDGLARSRAFNKKHNIS